MTQDVKILARYINALNKITSNVLKSVQQHEDSTADDRISNKVNGPENQ